MLMPAPSAVTLATSLRRISRWPPAGRTRQRPRDPGCRARSW
jgi:hypothetical protein